MGTHYTLTGNGALSEAEMSEILISWAARVHKTNGVCREFLEVFQSCSGLLLLLGQLNKSPMNYTPELMEGMEGIREVVEALRPFSEKIDNLQKLLIDTLNNSMKGNDVLPIASGVCIERIGSEAVYAASVLGGIADREVLTYLGNRKMQTFFHWHDFERDPGAKLVVNLTPEAYFSLVQYLKSRSDVFAGEVFEVHWLNLFEALVGIGLRNSTDLPNVSGDELLILMKMCRIIFLKRH
jgi:hypothetical protein